MIDLDAVSQNSLTAYNGAIARWTRLSGTAEERQAAEYAEAQLRTFGLAARILTHDAYISLPEAASLRLIRPQEKEIFCITHSMGMPTPPSGVAAELVYAGKGALDDYAKAGATGKVALVEGRATPQHAVNATRTGARALICISRTNPRSWFRNWGTSSSPERSEIAMCISSSQSTKLSSSPASANLRWRRSSVRRWSKSSSFMCWHAWMTATRSSASRTATNSARCTGDRLRTTI